MNNRMKGLLEHLDIINRRIDACVLHYQYAASGQGAFTEKARRKYLMRVQEEYGHLLIQRTILQQEIKKVK